MLKKIEFSNEEIREIDTYCRCMDKSFPHDYFKAKRKGKQRFTSILRSYVYALSLCLKKENHKPKKMGREVVKTQLRKFVSTKSCEIDAERVKAVILDIMKEKGVIETHGLWIPLQTVYSGDLVSALNDALPKYAKPKELERFDHDELIRKKVFSLIDSILKKEKMKRSALSAKRLETLLKKYKKTDILKAFSNNARKVLDHYDTCKETYERTSFLSDLRSRTSLRSLSEEEIEKLAEFGYKYKIIDKGKKSERVLISKIKR